MGDKHNNGKVFKITRAFVQIEEAAAGTITAIDTTSCDNAAACAANTKCDYSLRRYVITLDSMPTASVTSATYTATKTLLYKSPVGSCNVAETTKGTFESYECSNRGACDGKSGLCACYEG